MPSILAPKLFRLPELLINYPYWTPHKNKRPIIKIGSFEPGQALPYSAIEQNLLEQNDVNGVGLLLAPAELSNIAVIDVDFGGAPEEKEELQLAAIAAGFKPLSADWATEAYSKWISENTPIFASLKLAALQELAEQTYVEWSPSGLGLHIYVQLTDKHKTKVAYKKSTNFGLSGQISLQNCFITVTGIPLHGTVYDVKETSLLDFSQSFMFSSKTDTPAAVDKSSVPPEEALAGLPVKNISIESVASALSVVSAVPRLRTQAHWQEFTGRKYEHYDFWITIGMALHDWGTQTSQTARAFILWNDWSKTDEGSYKGEDDLEQHWRSFNSADVSSNAITIATLLALAKRLQFSYPVPLMNKGTVIPHYAQINEYSNFEYLMKYYNIELWEDDMYYISGDKEIMEQYFRSPKSKATLDKFYGPFTQKELASHCLKLCQNSNWRKMQSAQSLVQVWCHTSAKPLDLFTEWINTPFDKLPPEMHKIRTLEGVTDAALYNEQSTVEHLFKCLNVNARTKEEKDLYFSCLKKTFMQMIKLHEPNFTTNKFADNGGVLILAGPENTFKSTFLKLFLPESLNSLYKEVSTRILGEKSERDFKRLLGRKAVMVLDEIEGIWDFNKQSSHIKNIISGNDTSITDIYETTERAVPRKAILIGSTNQLQLPLSDNGTRRMWIIPVNTIDTVNAAKVNLHKMYNDLRKEFKVECDKGNTPWLLSQAEIDLLNKLNQGKASNTEFAIILEELWPASGDTMPSDYLEGIDIRRYKGPKLMSTTEIMAYMKFKGISPKHNLTVLEHALERHCGTWTDSIKEDIPRKAAVLRRGRLCQNMRPNGNYHFKKWVMPPVSHEDDPEEK